MRPNELRKEMGIPTPSRLLRKAKTTVVFSTSITLTKTMAEELIERMEADDITISALCRRLIGYYLAEHDGYSNNKNKKGE